MDPVDFSPVSFHRAMNHNQFSQEMEKMLDGYKYTNVTSYV